MILRRFMEHIKDQNWFAVSLDVLVVIVGIFLGTQATDWSERQHEREKSVQYMERIREDLQTDLDHLGWKEAFWQQVYDYSVDALAFEEKGTLRNESQWQTLLAFFQASQVDPYDPVMVTYSEMKSEGDIGLIDNLQLRKDLARYYGYTTTSQAEYVMRLFPKYRDIVRSLIPSEITAYIWARCHKVSDLERESFIDCKAPDFAVNYDDIFGRISHHPEAINELRSWASTQQIKFNLATTNISFAKQLKAMLDEEIKRAQK